MVRGNEMMWEKRFSYYLLRASKLELPLFVLGTLLLFFAGLFGYRHVTVLQLQIQTGKERASSLRRDAATLRSQILHLKTAAVCDLATPRAAAVSLKGLVDQQHKQLYSITIWTEIPLSRKAEIQSI